jgi:NADH dehydrogenase [ubiquinone] 1 alpha subcomplex assembly factor 3
MLRRSIRIFNDKAKNPFTNSSPDAIDMGSMRVQSTTLTDIFLSGDALANSNDLPLTQLNGYNATGFKVNGVRFDGSVLLLPRTFLRWNVSSLADLSLSSLIAATLYAPRISLLLIGTGDVFRPPTPHLAALMRELKQRHQIQVELMRSISAGSTFNFLNQEGRDVAAALLPPAKSEHR